MQERQKLLTTIQKQLQNLKYQLSRIKKQPQINKKKQKPLYHLSKSKFNNHCFDESDLDKGTRKFNLSNNNTNKFKNISEIIQQKSFIEKTPRLSIYRQAQLRKTKDNFSCSPIATERVKKLSPNPLTGEGYTQIKKGKKRIFPPKQNTQPRTPRQTQKRHYNIFLY